MQVPTRLPCETTDIVRDGERYHIGVCLHPETGEVCELSAHGPKAGSAMFALLQDVCISLSHTFKDGCPPGDMVDGVVRGSDGDTSSIYGTIIDLCASYEVG